MATEEKIKNEEIEIQQVEITLTESYSPEIIKKEEEKEVKEDEEEEPSINLFSHKNSLEYGNIKRSTNIQGGNHEECEEIEPLTPSTGN